MLVAVNEFGSIWTRRFSKGGDSPTRHAREAVFYNTTGVPVGDKIRARNRVYGVARFNGSAGFSPEAFVISVSESDLHQELMLLMTPFSWIRTAFGVYVLEPDATRPWRTQLVLDRRI